MRKYGKNAKGGYSVIKNDGRVIDFETHLIAKSYAMSSYTGYEKVSMEEIEKYKAMRT